MVMNKTEAHAILHRHDLLTFGNNVDVFAVAIVLERLEQGVEKFEDEIEKTIAEFGDLPEQCLSMISERIQLGRHFRAHPNARSEDL